MLPETRRAAKAWAWVVALSKDAVRAENLQLPAGEVRLEVADDGGEGGFRVAHAQGRGGNPQTALPLAQTGRDIGNEHLDQSCAEQ